MLIGEPNRWETHLQLLVDLLLTGGHPSFAPEGAFPNQHIPVLACNMDLVFMAEACMPRYNQCSLLHDLKKARRAEGPLHLLSLIALLKTAVVTSKIQLYLFVKYSLYV